jgi:TetR/AcrR family transcriptional regulator, regulator of cefoperazone and chloramphenicol sensitivity
MTTIRERRNRKSEAETRQSTRAQLLEAAGELFADKGFDAVTGKEICLKAGANAAAINYHFGGMEGLYAAVLQEARDRFVSQDAIAEALAAGDDMDAKLVALARTALRAMLGRGSNAWGLRLIGRELTSPSTAGATLLSATAKPRIALFRSIVCTVTGLPDDHPAVSRCCLTLAAPMQILMIADKDMLGRLYPDLDLSLDGVDALVEHLVRYASGGLRAVAEAETGSDRQA